MSTTPGSGEEPPEQTGERQVDQTDVEREREERLAARREQRASASQEPGVMIPRRGKRLPFEGPLMRLVATTGIVAIGVVIAAIMTSQHSQGWIIGLVVSVVTVVLAAVLWSSQRL